MALLLRNCSLEGPVVGCGVTCCATVWIGAGAGGFAGTVSRGLNNTGLSGLLPSPHLVLEG